MTLSLPRIDSRVMHPDGRFTREWYKALTTTSDTVNGIVSGQTIYSDAGAVNALQINSGVTAYTRGMQRYIVPLYTNTSQTVTLSDSYLPAKALKYADGSLPAIGQIVANVTISVVYNGTFWELQAISTASQSITGNLSIAGTLDVTGATVLHSTLAVTSSASASALSATTTVAAGTMVSTGATTVGALPAAASNAYARYFVTDATVAAAGNFGNVPVGGGGNKVPVYSDGTNWRIG
jgi:hypothetical protein